MSGLNILPLSTHLKRTTSRCPACLVQIPADVVERGGRVYMAKTCPEHGPFEVLIARDRRFYHVARGAGSSPAGCGSACGCGAAPEADGGRDPFEVLSTCVALIEIVDRCNLSCPTCYAASPRGLDGDVGAVDFPAFVERVQGVIDRKGFIDVLQLSGGEPTLHPRFFELLHWSLEHDGIGYVLINTNAVRIARDEAFRGRLGELRRELGGFELYVQFDGPQKAGQRELRGADLRDLRREAIDGAGALGVPSTLAMTVTPATLPHLGDTLRFGLARPHCRGITFQPMFNSGRTPPSPVPAPAQAPGAALALAPPEPISVGDVILAVIDQSAGLLTADDFTPLPCGDPNCHTIGYLLRTDEGPVGLGRLVDLGSLQGFLSDRVNYSLDDLARCGCETEPLGSVLRALEIGPERPFRLFIKPFMDAWTFDDDRIDRCCTHVIRPDGRLDSFCRHYLGEPAPAPAPTQA